MLIGRLRHLCLLGVVRIRVSQLRPSCRRVVRASAATTPTFERRLRWRRRLRRQRRRHVQQKVEQRQQSGGKLVKLFFRRQRNDSQVS
jgi:hypothetical protein